ncbi:uncharacterized protein PV09_02954 [Verruconis gallopava]|uniref:F-box domain-containing protein n=1 Tax=Verruconis gallopava TaxID=253628 RepID=A0A0D2AJ27_9PEZI|nr:uncharacterized protein PV09_02954 [Verruconis gallopava]KIW06520.1 hypothetical protein PV09_02954 [Verruconis gallopava]
MCGSRTTMLRYTCISTERLWTLPSAYKTCCAQSFTKADSVLPTCTLRTVKKSSTLRHTYSIMQGQNTQFYPACHLLGLPGELRGQILDYVFQGEDDYPNSRLKLPLVCRTFYLEACQLAWKHGTHTVSAPASTLQTDVERLSVTRRKTVTAIAYPSLCHWANLSSILYSAGVLPITETVIIDRIPDWEKPTLLREDTCSFEDIWASRKEIPHIPMPWEPRPPPDPRAVFNKALAKAVWSNPKLKRVRFVSSLLSDTELEGQASLLIYNLDEHLSRLADEEHLLRGQPRGLGRPRLIICGSVDNDVHSYINPKIEDQDGEARRFDELLIWREGRCMLVERNSS